MNIFFFQELILLIHLSSRISTLLVEGEPGPTPLSIVEFLYVQGEYKVTVHIVGY